MGRLATSILYAEDDPDDVDIFKFILSSEFPHLELIHARDGKDALAYLDSSARNHDLPQLVVLDCNMPRMGGIELLEIMKADQELRQVPVIMFSTVRDEVVLNRLKAFNVEILEKPMSLSETTAHVRTMVSGL